jgi:L-rhamnose mutarotase
MKQYCLALDLIDDEKLIKEYEQHHQNIWPEITESIFNSGIIKMEIFRFENRLFMIMQTEDSFSFESKNKMDTSNKIVKEWEQLMWQYQQIIPGSKPGEKWVLMENIFSIQKTN